MKNEQIEKWCENHKHTLERISYYVCLLLAMFLFFKFLIPDSFNDGVSSSMSNIIIIIFIIGVPIIVVVFLYLLLIKTTKSG